MFDLLREVGIWPVLAALLLALAVVVLRLAALPLAAAALGLDTLADLAARPLAAGAPSRKGVAR